MFLMYVDESGDCGLTNSPTRYFVLSGLVVHELSWQSILDQLIAFRRKIKTSFGLGMRTELHAGPLISRPGALVRIPRNDRLTILRSFANELGSLNELNIINVVVDKQGKPPIYDVFEMAWKVLIQRFENTLARRNFAGPRNPDDRGMLFPDRTDDKKLVALLRKMRRYNPIPSRIEYGPGSRNIVMTKVVEDPNFRDSGDSLFIQAADLAAFLLYQHLAPSSYMRKKSANNYFQKLEPVLCTVASSTDSMGIVRL